jgi:hypothetical protein
MVGDRRREGYSLPFIRPVALLRLVVDPAVVLLLRRVALLRLVVDPAVVLVVLLRLVVDPAVVLLLRLVVFLRLVVDLGVVLVAALLLHNHHCLLLLFHLARLVLFLLRGEWWPQRQCQPCLYSHRALICSLPEILRCLRPQARTVVLRSVLPVTSTRQDRSTLKMGCSRRVPPTQQIWMTPSVTHSDFVDDRARRLLSQTRRPPLMSTKVTKLRENQLSRRPSDWSTSQNEEPEHGIESMTCSRQLKGCMKRQSL